MPKKKPTTRDKLVELASGIAGHKESTAIGAALVAYQIMGEYMPEIRMAIDENLGYILGLAAMLYKGKQK
jgi:hypothetical protein